MSECLLFIFVIVWAVVVTLAVCEMIHEQRLLNYLKKNFGAERVLEEKDWSYKILTTSDTVKWIKLEEK